MTKKKRQKVYDKTDGHCGYCGTKIDFEDMQVDHMYPKWRYSDEYKIRQCLYGLPKPIPELNSMDNLMPSCRKCNHYKRASDVEGFRQLLLTLQGRLDEIYIYEVAVLHGIVKAQAWDGTFYFEKVNNQLNK